MGVVVILIVVIAIATMFLMLFKENKKINVKSEVNKETDVSSESQTSISDSEQIEPQTILNKEDCYKDIQTIRRWVQFFGWLTIVSIVLSIIVALSAIK
ncbi:MAG: hypothetical protein RR383_01900 [Muribaculaceae bacterium]